MPLSTSFLMTLLECSVYRSVSQHVSLELPTVACATAQSSVQLPTVFVCVCVCVCVCVWVCGSAVITFLMCVVFSDSTCSCTIEVVIGNGVHCSSHTEESLPNCL